MHICCQWLFLELRPATHEVSRAFLNRCFVLLYLVQFSNLLERVMDLFPINLFRRTCTRYILRMHVRSTIDSSPSRTWRGAQG